MAPPCVRVALPWLQGALAEAAANGAPPAMPALCWLGGRGRLVPGELRPWREWLLEPVGGAKALAAHPAGPALAQQYGWAGVEPGAWCIAQPVHLAAGLDHLRLAPLAAAVPNDDDAAALGALVSAHFGADEFTVAAYVEGAWLLHFARAVDCDTQPPDRVVGHNVHDFMPAGPDGARIRSLMNEIQMLLHDQPFNQQRERIRQLPVNGWWLWGFGGIATEAATFGVGQWQLRADDRWLRALWRGSVQDSGDSPQSFILPLHTDTLIALSQPADAQVDELLASIDAGLLSVLLTHVRQGTVQSLDVLAGSTALHVDARARLQFWRRPVGLSRWLT